MMKIAGDGVKRKLPRDKLAANEFNKYTTGNKTMHEPMLKS